KMPILSKELCKEPHRLPEPSAEALMIDKFYFPRCKRFVPRGMDLSPKFDSDDPSFDIDDPAFRLWDWELSLRDAQRGLDCGYVAIVPLKDGRRFEYKIKPPFGHREGYKICRRLRLSYCSCERLAARS